MRLILILSMTLMLGGCWVTSTEAIYGGLALGLGWILVDEAIEHGDPDDVSPESSHRLPSEPASTLRSESLARPHPRTRSAAP
jgi:hypothetical protein